MCAAETMGNPSSGCTTVQVPMSLSKRRHRQSLSLQLEQLGQLGSINSCERKKSASALSSPKVTEENKSMASFLGSNKQATRRKPSSSLCGTEEYLKGIELHGGASSDRKPTSFNPFRGHRRVGSGSTVTPCKSLELSQGGSLSFRKEKALESSPKEKGGSLHFSFRKEKALESSPKEKVGSLHLSFRKEKALESSLKEKGGSLHSSFRKEKLSSESPREKGGSLSFRKSDRFAVTKLAASLFHSPTKVERSISMSRVAQKAIQSEEVVSLRHQFQMSLDDGAQTTCKGSVLHTLPQDIEESARPLISKASSLRHESAIDSSKLLKDEGDEELFSTTAVGNPSSGLLSGHSQVFVNAPESVLSNLAVVAASNNEQPSCISELNSYGWTIKSDVPTLQSSSSENLCELAENNSKSCADAKTPDNSEILSPGTGPSSIGSQSSRMETDSSEENGEEKIYAVDDMIPSMLLLGTEKVTEEELTEAAVLSSLMSEEYLTGPLFFSSEDSQKNLLRVSSSIESIGLMKTTTGCDSDQTCLTKCVSFEPVARDKSKADGDRKSKVRKRRRSVSASGIGAMLLKVVRVSESGPMLTRRLPKVGPEVISGADAFRAREYVLQKTAQISMGRAHELSSSPVSAPALCQCASQDHVVRSTSFKSGDCAEIEQHPKIDLEGVDGPGCRVDCTCETRQRNQQTNISEMVPRHPANTDSVASACTHEGMIHDTSVETVELSSSHERVERVSSNLERTTPDGKSESQTKSALVNASTNTSASANADERRDRGKSRKKSSSRGRNSYDSDSLTEGPKTARSNSGLGRTHSNMNKQGSLDANVAISRERSRSFISRLQAPSGISSVDVFHLAPSSISILANPSFSSSHQDRLWEEQAEAYSSGGRGTPGRDDEAAAAATTAAAASATANVFLHSPSPGVAISSDDHQVPSATSGSLRRGLIDSSSTTAGAVYEEKGRHKRKGKRGRPHTPLRTLLADDVHRKGGARPSPEGGHFIQQIMSRIRGTSKSLSPKSPHNVPKRRNIWSSCICFSVK